MRQVLVTDQRWLASSARFAQDQIELVHTPRPRPSDRTSAMIIPASEWERGATPHIPVIVYGSLKELRALQDEQIGYLFETEALDETSVIEALRTLWREGAGGDALYLEEAITGANLSPREAEVIRQGVSGKSREETAAALGITDSTARAMRTTAFLKLGVRNLHELMSKLQNRVVKSRPSGVRPSEKMRTVTARDNGHTQTIEKVRRKQS